MGIRPGEKIHEVLISEEECHRTVEREKYYAIQPILPELRDGKGIDTVLDNEYSSAENPVGIAELRNLLKKERLMVEDVLDSQEELLR